MRAASALVRRSEAHGANIERVEWIVETDQCVIDSGFKSLVRHSLRYASDHVIKRDNSGWRRSRNGNVRSICGRTQVLCGCSYLDLRWE